MDALAARLLVLAAVGIAPALVAPSVSAGTSPPGPQGSITVFAAASLAESYTAIGDAFQAAHPGVTVEFNFASSSDLVRQITEGAPADVFASADLNNMTKLTDADAAGGEPATFATNSLEIVVESGNPLGIAGVADLSDAALIVVSCAPEVPIGAYTQVVLANAAVEVEFDSFEENVKAVVEKVALGEADAGIVYTTDVIAAGDDVDGIMIPTDINIVAEYPIVTTADAANPDLAATFVDFVLGDDGQAILAGYGFGALDTAPIDTAPIDTASTNTAAP